jgi:rare lipoprotein A
MNRMLTMIWALGVALFASQAQAVTRMGEDTNFAGNPVVADWVSGRSAGEWQVPPAPRAKQAPHASRQSKRPQGAASHRSASRSVAKGADEAQQVAPSPARTKHAARQHRRAPESSSFFGQIMTGIASYYWQPQRVASGGWFNPNAMTAAHKTLPFGTRVRVTHARTGRSVDVTINDRGPYIAGRIIDLSSAAAGAIGMKGSGLATVKLEVLGK